MALEDLDVLRLSDRAEWRRWLRANAASSSGVWLLIGRKGATTPAPTYEEAVEEAVAFGWVDSTVRPVDKESYRMLLTPRKPGSQWSRSNKERVERLTAEGRMTPAAVAAVEAAKADGSWTLLEDIEDLVVPDDLADALRSSPEAERNFSAMSDSAKRQFLFWVKTAKRPETRAKRLIESVRLAERNLTPDRRGEL